MRLFLICNSNDNHKSFVSHPRAPPQMIIVVSPPDTWRCKEALDRDSYLHPSFLCTVKFDVE